MKKTITILMFLVLMSSTVFGQWTQIGTITSKINSFYTNGGIIYVCYGSSSGGVQQSTDQGVTWTSFGGSGYPCYSVAIKNSTSAVIGRENGIMYFYQSSYFTLSNVTWQTKSVIYDGTNFYAGTSAGVYKSTNNGANWTGLGLNATNVVSLVKSGNNMWAGCVTGVYYSTDAGSNWTLTSLPNGASVNTIMLNTNGDLWVGTNQRVCRSTNSGVNFTTIFTDTAYSIIVNGGYMFEGVQSGVKRIIEIAPGVYQTAKRNGGFPSPIPTVYAITITNNYLIAGTGNGMWRAPYNYVTDVEKIQTEAPTKYSLSQNYPNPFNPSTTIRYQVPIEGSVKFKIYDIAGKEVETLVNEQKSPGTYEVNWNASQYSSGVYFYKIETESFTDTKRMILIK